MANMSSLRPCDGLTAYHTVALGAPDAATGRQLAGPSTAWAGLLLLGLGLLLALLGPPAAEAALWSPSHALPPVSSPPLAAAPLLAAKGFGTSTPKRSGAKKSKGPPEPEPYLSRPDPKPEPNLPIEQLPTTVFDYFNPGEPANIEVDPGVIGGLEILKFPDPRLRARSTEVAEENILSGEAELIARKMFDIMYAANGIGLAAPQVGISKRLIVFNPEGDRFKWQLEQVMINPEIVSFGSRIIDAPEGCLSFPKVPKVRLPFQKPGVFQGVVWRPDEITVQATNLRGQRSTFKFQGWAARIFQHEYDHLDGICWIDRLEDDERQRLDPFVKDLIAAYGEGGAIGPLAAVPRWRNVASN